MKNYFRVITCSTLLAMSSPIHAQQTSQSTLIETSATPNWEGLWVAERNFGVQLEGALTLQKSGDSWVAQIQGERAAANREVEADGSINWSFAFFDLGEFEGRQVSPDRPIDGHWVQPAGEVHYNPFATPVQLTPAGSGIYDGIIMPVQEGYSFNIPFTLEDTTEDGDQYRVFLRNPERNAGVHFRIVSATIKDGEILFYNRADEIIGRAQITEPGERFTLSLRGSVFEFTRRSRHSSPGFYPRRSIDTFDYLFRPAETGDGWSTAALGETGLNEAPVIALFNTLAALEPTGLREPYLHSLLVAHRGKLIVEEYFHGYHRDRPHDSRSAGKTIGSALLGMSIYQGALADVDQPVYPMFGGVQAFANPDSRKERLTARHLVTMSSGLACNDRDESSPGHEDTMQSQNEHSDWYKYALDLLSLNEPGDVGYYCSAGINLVGGIVAKATGKPLTRFFHESFAKPLQISQYSMNLSPSHRAYMGGGIQLRPRDFLKLGQLYLDGGVWNGQRLVSEDWVRESFEAHASLNRPNDYGFGWWRYTYEFEGRKIETYSASGNGGQILLVVPELDLTIMMNAGNYSDGRTRNALRDHIMWQTILPAAIAATGNNTQE